MYGARRKGFSRDQSRRKYRCNGGGNSSGTTCSHVCHASAGLHSSVALANGARYGTAYTFLIREIITTRVIRQTIEDLTFSMGRFKLCM